MVNDYYSYVEEQYAMVGERTGTRYRLGDTVTIIITRADIQARTLDFVLKDNGVYELGAVKQGAQKPAQKPAAKDDAKKRKRSQKKKGKGSADIIAAVPSAPETRRKKTRGAHGTGGSSAQRGDRAAKAAADSVPARAGAPARRAKSGKVQSGAQEERPGRGNRNERRRRDPLHGRADNGRGEERGLRDYHRVTVTGLNSAVWPDPPDYRAQRPDVETAEKPRRAPRPARRMNRKTEGGTRSAD